MRRRVEDYLDKVLRDLPDSAEMREFRAEVTGNMLGRMDDLLAKGLEVDDAFHQAVVELGDIRETALLVTSDTPALLSAKQKLRQKQWSAAGFAGAVFLIGFGLIVGTMLALESGWMMFCASGLPFIVSGAALAVAFGVLVFGLLVMGIVYGVEDQLSSALPVAIPFVLPGIAVLAYLYWSQREGEQVHG